MKAALFSVWALVFFASAAMAGSYGNANVPDCEDHDGVLPVNNEEVLQWKETTRNTYLARGHVRGVITDVYNDRNGHLHFQLKIGKSKEETVEIVYNLVFGSTRDVREGMEAEACGDYITSNAPNGRYQASPDGAIVHWVHTSTQPERHLSGFLVIDGELYGMDTSKARKRYR